MNRDAIDFHAVHDHHLAIHDALCNWARVVRVNITSGGNCTPMFKHYRTANYSFDLEDPEAGPMSDGRWVDDMPRRPPPDLQAGWRMEKAVSNLPEKERHAIRWHYVIACEPRKMARMLAVTPTVLHQLVHNARSMLKNRT